MKHQYIVTYILPKSTRFIMYIEEITYCCSKSTIIHGLMSSRLLAHPSFSQLPPLCPSTALLHGAFSGYCELMVTGLFSATLEVAATHPVSHKITADNNYQ